jgi:hypothetical protein
MSIKGKTPLPDPPTWLITRISLEFPYSLCKNSLASSVKVAIPHSLGG